MVPPSTYYSVWMVWSFHFSKSIHLLLLSMQSVQFQFKWYTMWSIEWLAADRWLLWCMPSEDWSGNQNGLQHIEILQRVLIYHLCVFRLFIFLYFFYCYSNQVRIWFTANSRQYRLNFNNWLHSIQLKIVWRKSYVFCDFQNCTSPPTLAKPNPFQIIL